MVIVWVIAPPLLQRLAIVNKPEGEVLDIEICGGMLVETTPRVSHFLAVSLLTIAATFVFRDVKVRNFGGASTITTTSKESGRHVAFTHVKTNYHPELPGSCKRYFFKKNRILSLKHGRFVKVPGREPPYDHNSCFLMKPRYNCATTNTTAPKSYEWKFILQSDPNDESTICDIGAIVDEFGGPAAITGTVALFGNSYQRQIHEAIACKYQDQLTSAIVTNKPPSFSLAAMKNRGGKPFTMREYGRMIHVPLNKRPLPRCSGPADEFTKFFRPGIDLTTSHLTDNCSDDISLMKYGDNLRILFNFHPEELENTVESYQRMLGFNVSDLDYVAYNNHGMEAFRQHFPRMNTIWADYGGLLHMLRVKQRRDAGQWFGADNPWLSKSPDNHSCLPGVADDEASLFLFSLFFGIRGFTGLLSQSEPS